MIPIGKTCLSPILSRRGLCVQAAVSYEEAMRELYQRNFHAFIVDVRLIDYDSQNLEGLDLVHHILIRHASAPIIILSGWSASLEIAKERFGNKDNVLILPKTEYAGVEMALDNLSKRLVGNIEISS